MRTLILFVLGAAAATAQSGFSSGGEIIYGGGVAQAPLQSRQVGMSISINSTTASSFKGDGTPAVSGTSMSTGLETGQRSAGDDASGSPREALETRPAADDPSQPLPEVALPAMDTDTLISELAGGPPENRAAAARRLAAETDPGVRAATAAPLRDALADPDPRVTSVIIGAVAQLGDAEAIAPLRDLVANGEDTVAVAAIQALVDLKDPELRDLLEPIAGSGTGPVAAAAAKALAGHRGR